MKLHLRATGCYLLYMRSPSVACHPTQVNTSNLNPSQRLVLDLSTPEEWKAELS